MMLYLVAFFVPPLAILLCGKVVQAFLNLLLEILGIVLLLAMGLGVVLMIGAMIHAFAVVAGHKADKRTNRLIAAMQAQRA